MKICNYGPVQKTLFDWSEKSLECLCIVVAKKQPINKQPHETKKQAR